MLERLRVIDGRDSSLARTAVMFVGIGVSMVSRMVMVVSSYEELEEPRGDKEYLTCPN